MKFSAKIVFEGRVPEFSEITRKVKENTGLDVHTRLYDNESKLEWLKSSGLEIVDISKLRLVYYCDVFYPKFSPITLFRVEEENEIEVETDYIPPHYLFEMTIQVLEQLGGYGTDNYTQPDWIGIKWKDKKWWQRIPK